MPADPRDHETPDDGTPADETRVAETRVEEIRAERIPDEDVRADEIDPAPPGDDGPGPVSPFVATPERASRVLALRVLLKSMIGVAFVVIVFVFFSAFLSDDGEEDTLPGLRVDIGDLASGETRTLTWDGRAVIVHRRTPEEIGTLEANVARSELRDPESAKSEQPESMRGTLRSETPEWFVAIGLGTDYGCPVGHLPADATPFAGSPWPGGFVDSCRGSRYDLAGRVYAGQYADRNLVVPPHTVSANGTLVLGR